MVIKRGPSFVLHVSVSWLVGALQVSIPARRGHPTVCKFNDTVPLVLCSEEVAGVKPGVMPAVGEGKTSVRYKSVFD